MQKTKQHNQHKQTNPDKCQQGDDIPMHHFVHACVSTKQHNAYIHIHIHIHTYIHICAGHTPRNPYTQVKDPPAERMQQQ